MSRGCANQPGPNTGLEEMLERYRPDSADNEESILGCDILASLGSGRPNEIDF